MVYESGLFPQECMNKLLMQYSEFRNKDFDQNIIALSADIVFRAIYAIHIEIDGASWIPEFNPSQSPEFIEMRHAQKTVGTVQGNNKLSVLLPNGSGRTGGTVQNPLVQQLAPKRKVAETNHQTEDTPQKKKQKSIYTPKLSGAWLALVHALSPQSILFRFYNRSDIAKLWSVGYHIKRQRRDVQLLIYTAYSSIIEQTDITAETLNGLCMMALDCLGHTDTPTGFNKPYRETLKAYNYNAENMTIGESSNMLRNQMGAAVWVMTFEHALDVRDIRSGLEPDPGALNIIFDGARMRDLRTISYDTSMCELIFYHRFFRGINTHTNTPVIPSKIQTYMLLYWRLVYGSMEYMYMETNNDTFKKTAEPTAPTKRNKLDPTILKEKIAALKYEYMKGAMRAALAELRRIFVHKESAKPEVLWSVIHMLLPPLRCVEFTFAPNAKMDPLILDGRIWNLAVQDMLETLGNFVLNLASIDNNSKNPFSKISTTITIDNFDAYVERCGELPYIEKIRKVIAVRWSLSRPPTKSQKK